MRWNGCAGWASPQRIIPDPLVSEAGGFVCAARLTRIVPRKRYAGRVGRYPSGAGDSCRRGFIIETPMVRDGFFYALGLAVVAAIMWELTHSYGFCAVPVLLAVFFLWFFRD